MHPRQHQLPGQFAAVWLASLADAGIDPDAALLFLLERESAEGMARAASTDTLDGIETAFRLSEPRELAQGFVAPIEVVSVNWR